MIARRWHALAGMLLALGAPGAVQAQDGGAEAGGGAAVAGPDGGGPDAAERTGGTAADAGVVDLSAPPLALAPIRPAYPPEAQKAGVAGDVILLLTIDELGTVTSVEVESGLPGGLTEAAVAAAKAVRFRAALDARGQPRAVRLRWTVHFTLPEVRKPTSPPPSSSPSSSASPSPSALPPPEPPLPPNVQRYPTGPLATLAVTVREKGTGKRLPLAMLWVEDVGELVRVDPEGRAERALAPGAYVVVIRAPGHQQEERIERLHAGERLERAYFIEKERLNEYETIVRAVPPRAETGVVTLQAEEIHSIPGTFGDPFRAAMLLPGVGSVISGLGYPIIRGEAPGQTGTFIDDVKVPLLYHLGFGPAVVHPLYLESLDFHPGNFPAELGRFTGGLIRAKTTSAPDERQTMLEADLFKLSAYHAQPLTVAGHAAAVSAAARYGTFSFLARALDPNAVLGYWDFQTRADLRTSSGVWRLLIFGANDSVGTAAHTDEDGGFIPEEVLRVGFNRLDLRYRMFRRGRVSGDFGVEAGPDYTTNSDPANDLHITEWVVRPRAAVDVQLGARLKLRAGADTLFQSWRIGDGDGDGSLGETIWPRHGLTYGAYLQAEAQPTPDWLIVGGVRGDLYDYRFAAERATATSLDPRLAVRRRLRPGLFVKAAAGVYHAPPRFLVPWPGLTGFGLRENGLNKSDQVSAGVEATLPLDLSLDAQVYFNWLARVTEYDITEFDDRSMDDPRLLRLARTGRSYGLELILRRKLGQRLFGWFTYTLARAERQFAPGWRPADFDQTQIVNAIVSYALGRSWTVSGTFHYNGGRPVTPQVLAPGMDGTPTLQTLEEHRNSERLPSFWRVDARIEKREAFDTWYLDFYVDWLNISLQKEISTYRYSLDGNGNVRRRGEGGILTIPTIGLRVVF